MTYVEFPHDHIVELHVRPGEPPPPDGEPPGGEPGPCESWFYSGEVGISIIYINLGAAGTAASLNGTYVQPVNWPPIAWGYLPPPFDGPAPGSQIFVPGANARSVTISITNNGPMDYWVRPATKWVDPIIWTTRPDGGVDFLHPGGAPTGTGALGLTIPHNIFPDPSNPQNLGTTIQIKMDSLPGQALSVTASVVHDCVAG